MFIQLITCQGQLPDGTWEDITDKVDWYVEEYPFAIQTIPASETVSVDENGLATILESWGRVNVSACYPKGCGPGNEKDALRVLTIISTVLGGQTLSVTNPGEMGSVTSTPIGIECGGSVSDCEKKFKYNSTVSLRADAAAGYSPGEWSGACSGTASEDCEFTMDSPKTVSVSFNVN